MRTIKCHYWRLKIDITRSLLSQTVYYVVFCFFFVIDVTYSTSELHASAVAQGSVVRPMAASRMKGNEQRSLAQRRPFV